jgi:type I restriction enzyme S subunit
MPGPDRVDGVPYVRVADMKEGGIDLQKIRRTTHEISDSYSRSLLRCGDLLMSIRGHVGRLATIPLELEGANITQDTARLALVGISSIYVRECLRSIGMQRWMKEHTKGVGVQGINLGDVKRLPIPIPSTVLQKKFELLISGYERMLIAKLGACGKADVLVSSLQHAAFEGKL